MLPRILLSTVLLLGVPSFALAQTTTIPSPGASSSGLPGKMMTEAQIKQMLQKEGYSNVQLKRMAGAAGGTGTTGGSGTSANEGWIGTAMKAGKKVNFNVDPHGMVTER